MKKINLTIIFIIIYLLDPELGERIIRALERLFSIILLK